MNSRPGARASHVLTISTYLVAAIGLFVGFITVFAAEFSLTWVALPTVGCGGMSAFIRHTLVPGPMEFGWAGIRKNLTLSNSKLVPRTSLGRSLRLEQSFLGGA